MINKLSAILLVSAFAPGLAMAQTSNSLTAMHARSAMTTFGCTGITPLGVGPDSSYHAQCQKGGKMINVMMDKTGTVSEVAANTHVTEGRARYEMAAFGCSNISELGNGPDGSWHGQCYKAGAPINVMVDNQGVASVAKPTHLTHSAARSILTSYGCSGITALNMNSNGSWTGQCSKSGKLTTVMVDQAGKVEAN